MNREQKLRYIGEPQNEEPHEEYKAMLQAREVERIRRLQKRPGANSNRRSRPGRLTSWTGSSSRGCRRSLQKIAASR